MCEVNVITGELTRYEVDLYLPGFIPVEFARTYKSTRSAATALGYGWTHSLDLFLRWDGARFIFHNEDGEAIPLAFEEQEGQAANQERGVSLTRESDTLILEVGDSYRYLFPYRTDAEGFSRLRAVEDIHGNRLQFAYDRNGLLYTLTDTLNRELEFKFDGSHRLAQVGLRQYPGSSHLARYVRYAYDDRNDLIAVEDTLGRRVLYQYADHLLVREVDPAGASSYWAYDASRRCVETWRDGGVLYRRLEFDDAKRVIRVTDSLGYITLYGRNEQFNIVFEKNARGEVIENVYDESGRMMLFTSGDAAAVASGGMSLFDEEENCLTEIDASGKAKQYFFDAQNLLVKIAGEDGQDLYLLAYDARGRITRRMEPEGAAWQFEYAPQGYASKVVNPLGYTVYQRRSPDGRLIELRDDMGPLQRSEYDLAGSLTAFTDAAGRTTRFEYDAGGRPVRATDPDGHSVQYRYDLNDRITAIIDEQGRTFRYEYDAAGELVRKVDPLGQALAFEYDTEQRMTTMTNWKGEKATFAYDPLGQLAVCTFFDGRTEHYAYDAASNLIAVTGAAGQRTEYAYEAGSLHSVVRPDGSEVQYAFEMEHLAYASDGQVELSRAFDDRRRMVREACADWEIRYAYDAMDNLVRVEDSRGHVVRYEYDGRRRLTQLDDSLQGVHTFAYNELDLLVRWQMPNGIVQHMQYDRADRLVEITAVRPDGQEVVHRSFQYDALGRLVRKAVRKAAGAPVVTDYEYDQLDRLTRVVRDGRVDEWYEYDANGNITRCTDYTAAYGPGNRLLTAGEVRYEYDPEGNLTARVDEAGTTRFRYNAGGELSEVHHPDGGTTTFQYDPVGRRIAKVHNGEETRYYWDVDTVVREESASAAQCYHFLPTTFFPIGFTPGEEPHFVLFDQLATPEDLLDARGEVVWSRSTNAFGRRLAPGPDRSPIGFQGQYRDEETGLDYNYFRYYDPRIARYITQDPVRLAGGDNLYRYVTNPLTWVDPLGLFVLKLKARCDWNQEQMKAFQDKVKRYDKIIKEEKEGIKVNACAKRTKNQKDQYENKCKNGKVKQKSPKGGKGNPVDCTMDVDHIRDLQLGGEEECDNLVPVNSSVNRSLGSQIMNQIKAAGKPPLVVTGVEIVQRNCKSRTPRTPACA